ncbi:hypothetical protein ID866_8742, partial [Astraeus odoratus]
NFYVVYYNSRGVGKSTGYPSFTGRQEGEDLQELVRHFLRKEPHLTSVTIIGYSHGSLIATLQNVLPSPIKTSYVLLSYPLSPRGLLTLFHAKTYAMALDTLLRDARTHVLIIYGEHDEFTSRAKYGAWTESLRKTSEGGAQLNIASVAEANHFWHSNSARTALRNTLESWLGKTITLQEAVDTPSTPPSTENNVIGPLPDERPRQSVANLIGRFEQQNKRQSSPGTPVVPRHPASDGAKDEAKEKREWPPKSVASTDTKSVMAVASPSPVSTEPRAASPKPTADAPADGTSSSSPVSPKSPPPKNKASTAGMSTPTPSARRAPSSPAKSRPSTAIHSPAKSLVRPHPPKTSLSSATAQPLRPQHTGQSVTSNASASASRTPRPTPKAVTLTPSRPKTPAAHGTSRPKTPSSGLFAPTAASLARSRNAPPPMPPPVKKATLSSSAAERLSKPTAASLSKARTPISTTPSPSRVAKSISTGATPRNPSKLKVGQAPARAKDAKDKEPMKAATSQASGTSSSEVAQVSQGNEQTVCVDGDTAEDLHSHAIATSEEPHSELSAEPETADPQVESYGVPEPPSQLPDEPSHVHEPIPEQSSLVQDPLLDLDHEGVNEEAQEEERQSVIDATKSHETDALTNGNGYHNDIPATSTIGQEIEDMVNLLETTSLSKPRPQSMITIPDEHGDTSDEC